MNFLYLKPSFENIMAEYGDEHTAWYVSVIFLTHLLNHLVPDVH